MARPVFNQSVLISINRSTLLRMHNQCIQYQCRQYNVPKSRVFQIVAYYAFCGTPVGGFAEFLKNCSILHVVDTMQLTDAMSLWNPLYFLKWEEYYCVSQLYKKMRAYWHFRLGFCNISDIFRKFRKIWWFCGNPKNLWLLAILPIGIMG